MKVPGALAILRLGQPLLEGGECLVYSLCRIANETSACQAQPKLLELVVEQPHFAHCLEFRLQVQKATKLLVF